MLRIPRPPPALSFGSSSEAQEGADEPELPSSSLPSLDLLVATRAGAAEAVEQVDGVSTRAGVPRVKDDRDEPSRDEAPEMRAREIATGESAVDAVIDARRSARELGERLAGEDEGERDSCDAEGIDRTGSSRARLDRVRLGSRRDELEREEAVDHSRESSIALPIVVREPDENRDSEREDAVDPNEAKRAEAALPKSSQRDEEQQAEERVGNASVREMAGQEPPRLGASVAVLEIRGEIRPDEKTGRSDRERRGDDGPATAAAARLGHLAVASARRLISPSASAMHATRTSGSMGPPPPPPPPVVVLPDPPVVSPPVESLGA